MQPRSFACKSQFHKAPWGRLNMTTICRTRIVHSSSNFHVAGMPTVTSLLLNVYAVWSVLSRLVIYLVVSSYDLFCRRHRSWGDGFADLGCAKIRGRTRGEALLGRHQMLIIRIAHLRRGNPTDHHLHSIRDQASYHILHTTFDIPAIYITR